ncbi:hypothetical protein BDZ91DRAFT_69068 [Kalaharituber pfeilii]|nr:hypothetical protein BDZ91DRAFT_69068 [Kalaharituber pfeilii]
MTKPVHREWNGVYFGAGATAGCWQRAGIRGKRAEGVRDTMESHTKNDGEIGELKVPGDGNCNITSITNPPPSDDASKISKSIAT